MSTPSLEVLIPCYNEQLHIAATIDSILNASLKWPGKFTLIISDNHSTDGTQEVLEKYIIDQRVVTLGNEYNLGAKENFFKLFASSAADYIMFMGAHDQISSNFFEDIFKKLNENTPKILAGIEKQLLKKNNIWQIGPEIPEKYNFSRYRFIRMTQAILYLHKSTEFHSVVPRKLLLNKQIEKSRTLAIDHLVLYILLSKCNLEYVEGAYFIRRYEENIGDFYARLNSGGELEDRLERATGKSKIPAQDRFMGLEIFQILKGDVNFIERIFYMLLLNSKNSQHFIIRSPYRLIRYLVTIASNYKNRDSTQL